MKLRDWMIAKNVSVLEAAQMFGASIHTVKKWLKYDQKDGRIPRPKAQAKIREKTNGEVMPNDWVV